MLRHRFPPLRAILHVVAALGLAFFPAARASASGAKPPAQAAPPQAPDTLMHDEIDALVPPDAVFAPVNAVAATGDYRIDALMSGYRLPTTTVTYSFYSDAVFAGSYYGSETVSEVSAGVKANVRAVMAWYSALLNVNFVEVTETTNTIGYIRIMKSSGPSYAYAYYPAGTTMFSASGDVHLNPGYDRLGDTNGFQNPPGEHGYLTLIHEIGHAIGLKHPFDGSPNLPTVEDNFGYTVMTYTFTGRAPATPMTYDLLALDYLYGGRASHAANDTYVPTRANVDQYSVGGQTVINPSNATKLAIWDTGGYNELDLSTLPASASGYRIDLRPLGWITTGANYKPAGGTNTTTYFYAGLCLGPGVSIRRIVNSSSGDYVYAGVDATTFAGYASTRATGADVIEGADGTDTIDLSGYQPNQVTETMVGSDLVIGLGANGSITVKGYYSGATSPVISYGGVTPAASIGDVSVLEGNGGTTTAVFTVSLSSPAAVALSLAYATAAGTATAGSDFVPTSGTLTFPAGQTSRTLSVTINGDTTVEPDEVFSVLLSAPGPGLTIAGAQGNGAIRNDDTLNQPPLAAAAGSPTSGVAPLAVSFTSTGSSDPDGTIGSYAWTFGDGAAFTGANAVHTYTSVGTFAATLTVTDNRGATASRSVTITVTPPAGGELWISAMALSAISASGETYASGTVTVTQTGNVPLAGATVTVNWSGLAKGTAVGTTNADGQVVFRTKPVRRTGAETLTVTRVAKTGFAYAPTRNVVTSAMVTMP